MSFCSHVQPERKSEYATTADFERIFQAEMTSLYLLAFVLAADASKAEECFVSGIADSTKAGSVFREWANDWARRTIVQNAIRLLAPQAEPAADPWETTPLPPRVSLPPEVAADENLAHLIQLPDFERFAFVMTVLEHYSDQDSALLLGCQRRQVSRARQSAIERLAHSKIPLQRRISPNVVLTGISAR
jgi:DNA-directed RNA polymerase specialized sigma24 family protein